MAGQVPGDPVVVPFQRPSGLSKQGWQVLQDRARDLAESLTPHRTGDLRNAWGLQPGARGLQLTNRLDYADYVDKGTLTGKYQRGTNGAGGMAPRNFSQKIVDQLGALAGQLMQQYPAATGGTNQANVQSQQYIGQQLGKEFEYGNAIGKTKPFSDLGKGFGASDSKGDFGANISVTHPSVAAALQGLTGPARQQAFIELLAGSHKYAH